MSDHRRCNRRRWKSGRYEILITGNGNRDDACEGVSTGKYNRRRVVRRILRILHARLGLAREFSISSVFKYRLKLIDILRDVSVIRNIPLSCVIGNV